MQKLLFILLLCSGSIAAQHNLVLNPSLEAWENGMPEDWEIVEKTVDIFKSNHRVIPVGVSQHNAEFRSRFPEKGSHGITYFGLRYDEIIKCRLRNPMMAGHYYKLSLHIRKPPIYNTATVTHVFTGQFKTPRDQPGIIPIEAPHPIDTSYADWYKVETIIKGTPSKDELYFGFFGHTYDYLGLNANELYYLFDEVALYQSEIKTDTLTFRFASNQYALGDQQKEQILSAVSDKIVESVTITGQASVIGDDADNLTLAGKRADAVKTILEPLDIPLIVVNKGENESHAGREAADRNVVVEVRYHVFPEDPDTPYQDAFSARLSKELRQMEEADQAIRVELDDEMNPDEYQTVIQEMVRRDSIHQQRLSVILDSMGYPGLSVVGAEYMDAAFLLIHHSPLAMRLKYEDLIMEAIHHGEATVALLPYFTDRNRLDQGMKQIYGTQLYLDEESDTFKLFDLEYPDHVDALRKETGLGPIEEYVQSFNED